MARPGTRQRRELHLAAAPPGDEPGIGRLLPARVGDGPADAPVRRLPRDVNLYSSGDTGDWLHLAQAVGSFPEDVEELALVEQRPQSLAVGAGRLDDDLPAAA